MNDWSTFLNGFLELSSYPILADKGRVSALEAKLKAEGEYEVYRKRQDAEFISDFDRVIAETKRLEGSAGRKVIAPGRERERRATKSGNDSSKGRKKS